MKKTKPARKKLELEFKRELIKILTTYNLRQARGAGYEDGPSSSGNSNVTRYE